MNKLDEFKYNVAGKNITVIGIWHIKFAAYKISCVTRCECNGL